MLKKPQSSSHLRKHWACVPLYFVLFHSPQPNNIGPAQQQPRALFLISLSLVWRGKAAQLLHISFATTGQTWGLQLKQKRNGRLGGTHFSPTALRLGISASPHPRTQVSEFGLGLGGGTKVLYPPGPDYRRLKISSFISPGHTHSHVCAPTVIFSFCRIEGYLARVA